MPPFGHGVGLQNVADAAANAQNNNNGWLDRVLGRVDDGFSVYDRVRCAVKPEAPGCHQSPYQQANPGLAQTTDTWLYIGLGVIILLVVALVVIALKK